MMTKTFRLILNRMMIIAVASAWGLAPAWAAPNAADTNLPGGATGIETSPPTASITGFRSAHFGMPRADVINAITSDFKVEEAAIVVARNQLEKTTILSVKVPPPLPDGGPAQVSYILGYNSKSLTQINVGWGQLAGEQVAPNELATTANLLLNHFAGLGFAPDRAVANLPLGNGSRLIFRGTDDDGRMALLVLLGTVPPAGDQTNESGQPQQPTWTALQLSYMQDPEEPDIFRITPGDF